MGGKKRVLVVDIGGNNIKLLASGKETARKIPSGRRLTPRQLVARVLPVVADWRYDVVSIGYPGVVRDNQPAIEPVNLGRGWTRFDFAKAFKRPVRVVNDAAMQALGSYAGKGRMLFLGLGTGLGSALIVDGVVCPAEMSTLYWKNGRTLEELLGIRGLNRAGKKRWRAYLPQVVERLRHALQVDDVVIGGGNAKKLKAPPAGARLGDNANAFAGGFRLWQTPRRPRRR
jgi:predicted NBD/HSP70 family sugar kinase